MVKKEFYIQNQKFEYNSKDEFIQIWKVFENDNYIDFYCKSEDDKSLILLKNDKFGFAIYMDFDGDSGFTSCDFNNSKEIFSKFILSNGQIDELAEFNLFDHSLCLNIVLDFIILGKRSELINWKN